MVRVGILEVGNHLSRFELTLAARTARGSFGFFDDDIVITPSTLCRATHLAASQKKPAGHIWAYR